MFPIIQLHVRDVLALSIEQVELQADVVSYGAVSGRIRHHDQASRSQRGFSCYEGPSRRCGCDWPLDLLKILTSLTYWVRNVYTGIYN